MTLTDEELKGYTAANQAALYAHLRTLIAGTLFEKNPVVGFHGVMICQDNRYVTVMAGGTPEPASLYGMLAGLQGEVLTTGIARQIGNIREAKSGDMYDPELNAARCVSCEGGDPTGSHAEEELRENGKAWLGLVIEVAERFYGAYLTEEAKALLMSLRAEALPTNQDVS